MIHFNEQDRAVRARQEIELAVVTAAVSEILANGFTIRVHDGEDVSEPLTEKAIILDRMFDVDDEWLLVYRDGKRFGQVYLVYGNDGYDVICDNSISLEPYLTEASALTNRYMEAAA